MAALVGDILGRKKIKLLNQPSTELVLPDTDIGVEFEVESVDSRKLTSLMTPEILHYWENHEDPSLHDLGMEFVFRTPLYGSDVIKAVQSLCEIGVQGKWKPSKRTGIHVHMDARDLSRHQLLGLISYYLILEPALYEWVGDSRHSNNFCLPYYKSEGALHQARDILWTMRQFEEGTLNKDVAIIACDAFDRYAGLNLKSLALYGSLEFRQLQTTLDSKRIIRWINLLLSLKKAALDVPESSQVILNEFKRFGIRAMVERIFGANMVGQMTTPEVIERIEEYGIPNALYLIHHVTKVVDKPKEIKWDPAIKATKRGQHPGLMRWNKATFPDGGEAKVELDLKKPHGWLEEVREARAPDELIAADAEVAELDQLIGWDRFAVPAVIPEINEEELPD